MGMPNALCQKGPSQAPCRYKPWAQNTKYVRQKLHPAMAGATITQNQASGKAICILWKRDIPSGMDSSVAEGSVLTAISNYSSE